MGFSLAIAAVGALTGCATPRSQTQHGQLHVADWNLDKGDDAPCAAWDVGHIDALGAYAANIPADVILFRATATPEDMAKVFPKETFAELQWVKGASNCADTPRLIGAVRRRGGPRPFAMDRIGPSPVWAGMELSIRLGSTPLLRLLEVDAPGGCEAGRDGPACERLFGGRAAITAWFTRQSGRPAAVWGDFHRRHYGDHEGDLNDVFFDDLKQPHSPIGMSPGHWPYATCHNLGGDNSQAIWSKSTAQSLDYIRPIPWKDRPLSQSCALVVDFALRDLERLAR